MKEQKSDEKRTRIEVATQPVKKSRMQVELNAMPNMGQI